MATIYSLEARITDLETQLNAMTEDRDLWRSEHDGDCPNLAQLDEARATIMRLKAPVSRDEWEHHYPTGKLAWEVMTDIIAARASQPSDNEQTS